MARSDAAALLSRLSACAARLFSRALAALRMHLGERAPVLVREHLDELRARRVPIVEQRQRERAAREAQVPLDLLAQQRLVGLARVPLPALARRGELLFRGRLLRLRSRAAPAPPSTCCNAARTCRRRRRRTRCRRSCRPRSCARSGPSTTTVPPVMYSQPWSPVPSTTADRAGVAHAEALAGDAAEVRLAVDRAVHHRVADDDVLLRHRGARRDPDRRRCVRRTAPCRRSRSSRPAART